MTVITPSSKTFSILTEAHFQQPGKPLTKRNQPGHASSILNLLKSSLFILLAACLLVPGGCRAQGKSNPPPERLGFVSDHASVFTREEAVALEEKLQAYERKTCHQILVLTVPSLNGEPIGEFSARTATAWEIGQPILMNGVLLTIAMQEGSVRIETGSGLDFLVKQGIGEQILQQQMLPLFREGHIAAGITRGAEELMTAARSQSYPDDHRPAVCRQ